MCWPADWVQCLTLLRHTTPSSNFPLARAQLRELLETWPTDPQVMRAASQPAQALFALSRLEAEPLPEADYPAPRSLESLRLDDPAAMFGCWNPRNPGCVLRSHWQGRRGEPGGG